MRFPRRSSPGFVLPIRFWACCLIAVAATAAAASEEARHAGEADEAAHGQHSARGRHEVAVFLGFTDDRGEDAFSWGVEYAYGVLDDVAVGALVERAEGDVRSTIAGVPIAVNPVGRLDLVFAPAVEIRDEAEREGAEGNGETGSEREFAARIGATYAFHLGRHCSVAPSLYVDFVGRETLWVGGVSLG